MYIYIDESGQFKKNGQEDYFVVASFIIKNHKRTRKEFRKWQKDKFPRKMKHQPEIKFCVDINPNLRLRTIQCISDLDVRIRYAYILKKNIPHIFWKKDKLQSGKLYMHIIGELLESYLPLDNEVRVFCDQRHLKGIKRSEFKETLKMHLLTKMPSGSRAQVEMINSVSDYNIQIADWIVGALARFLEKKELGEEMFGLLKNNIIDDGLELFETSTLLTKQKTQED